MKQLTNVRRTLWRALRTWLIMISAVVAGLAYTGQASAQNPLLYVPDGSFAAGVKVSGIDVDADGGNVYVVQEQSCILPPFCPSVLPFDPGLVLKFTGAGTPGTPAQFASSGSADYTGVAVAPGSGLVHALSRGTTGEVQAFTAAGTEQGSPFPVSVDSSESTVAQIATDAAGAIYYPNAVDGTVERIDPSDGSVEVAVAGLASPTDVSVDADGNIYVADNGQAKVLAFDAAGDHLFDLVSGGENYAVTVNRATGEVLVGQRAGANWTITVYDENQDVIDNFGQGLIANNAGNRIAVVQQAGLDSKSYVTEASSGKVFRFDRIEAPDPPDTKTLPPDPLTQLTATIRGTVDPLGEPVSSCRFEWGTDSGYGQSVPCAQSPATIGSGQGEVQVSANLTGLEPSTTYHYRLVADNLGGAGESEDQAFTTLDLAAPGVTLGAVGASATEAGFEGTVNPHASEVTSCAFIVKAISPPSAHPPGIIPCDPSPGAGVLGAAVSAHASKLLPSATYEVTLVAENGEGESRQTAEFKTRSFAELAAPGRANELVSPGGSEKGGADASHELPWAYFAPQISDDGDRVVFPTRGAFGDPDGFSGLYDGKVLSTRSESGWNSKGVSLPMWSPCTNFEIAVWNDWLACLSLHGYKPPIFSRDLYRSVQGSASRSLGGVIDPGRALVNMNLYRLDTEKTPWSRDLITSGPVPDGATNALTHGLVAATTPDLSNVVFLSNRELSEDAPHDPLDPDRPAVWEWAEDGLHLVSILPDDTPTVGTVGQIGSAAGSDFRATNSFASKGDRSISVDGKRIYFSAPAFGTNRRLYLRRDRQDTVAVSQPQAGCGTCTQGMDSYWSASLDGRKVFFSSTGRLTADAAAGTNLYRWFDNGSTDGRLALVTKGGPAGAGLQGVMAISDDGDVAYFVSTAQLTSDAPTGSGHKVYMWRDTGGGSGDLRFIAAIATAAANSFRTMWSPRGYGLLAPSSPDGRYMAFLTTTNLTASAAGAPTNVSKAYLYDSEKDVLQCVSCFGDDAASMGHVYFNPARAVSAGVQEAHGYHIPRNLAITDEGRVRVGFTAEHALLPGRDTNGTFDAYLWEDGDIHLISSGVSRQPSDFVDMDPSGDNLVFLTRERLSGWDRDSQYDFYTARLGGGLPEPDPVQVCGNDAECRGPSAAGPDRQEFGTAAVAEPEQAAPSSSPKATVRCVAQRRQWTKSRRRAKALVRMARRASGARAKKLRTRAKQARRINRKHQRQVQRCVSMGREGK